MSLHFSFGATPGVQAIALLLLWAGMCSSSSSAAQEQQNEKNCKQLCQRCDGIGFYCGEECICECNDDRSDTECIATMQQEARQSRAPFEILIQGPGKNRFVRNALQFEQNAERRQGSASMMRNKRSTVVIYTPMLSNGPNETYSKQLAAAATAASEAKTVTAAMEGTTAMTSTSAMPSSTTARSSRIKKRSINQLNWLNDATANARPSPLLLERRSEDANVVADVLQPQSLTKSDLYWANARSLLPPSGPLLSHYTDTAYIERLPQVLKDTISSIKSTGVNDEFGEALHAKMLEENEALQRQLQGANFKRFLRESVSKSMKDMEPNKWRSEEAALANRNSALLWPLPFMDHAEEANN